MHTHISTYGSGKKTLVLFSGWNHSFENEQPFLELLAKKHTVLVVSLPGYSGTPESQYFVDFPALAQDVQKQLTTLGHLDATLVGFSMGCYLVAELARIMPVKNPILIGCPLNIVGVPRWVQLLFKSATVINLLRKNKPFTTFAVLKALRAISEDQGVKFSDRATTLTGAFDSLVDLLKSTAVMTPFFSSACFIYGEHDPHLAEARNANVKHLRIVADAGHACVWGHEERVVSAVLLFLGSSCKQTNQRL